MSFDKGKAVSAQMLSKIIGKSAGAATGPVGFAAGIANTLGKKITKEVLGYDFWGLAMKLVAFYVIAYVIKAYFDAVIAGSGFVKTAASLFGFNLPNVLPKQVSDFMKFGIPIPLMGQKQTFFSVKYWDVIHVIVTSLLLAEALQYYNNNKNSGGKASYFGIGVFAMLIGAVTLLWLPGFIQRYKDAVAILTGNEGPATIIPPNVGPAWLPVGYSYVQSKTNANYYALVGSMWQLAIQDSATTGHLSGIPLSQVP